MREPTFQEIKNTIKPKGMTLDEWEKGFKKMINVSKSNNEEKMTVGEWAENKRKTDSANFQRIRNTFYRNLMEDSKMKHEEIVIKITNNGFFVSVGCQDFVFGTEKELFQAISDYNKDPEKAREKYCRKGE